MGYTENDFVNADMELYILITGFDDVFSSPLSRRTSYTYKELQFNARFLPMDRKSDDGQVTILELHKLNSIEKVGQQLENKMLGSNKGFSN